MIDRLSVTWDGRSPVASAQPVSWARPAKGRFWRDEFGSVCEFGLPFDAERARFDGNPNRFRSFGEFLAVFSEVHRVTPFSSLTRDPKPDLVTRVDLEVLMPGRPDEWASRIWSRSKKQCVWFGGAVPETFYFGKGERQVRVYDWGACHEKDGVGRGELTRIEIQVRNPEVPFECGPLCDLAVEEFSKLRIVDAGPLPSWVSLAGRDRMSRSRATRRRWSSLGHVCASEIRSWFGRPMDANGECV